MTSGEIRLLDAAALRRVYRDHVKADFPPAERKPLSMIERQVRTGQYDTLGLFQGEELLAYAFLWRDSVGRCALLDYLAVCRGGRGQGTGSAFLEQLKAHYGGFDGLLVEAEAEDPQAGEEQNALRRRRIDFYRRCGFRMLDYRARLFGVTYSMLASGTLTEADALAAHRRHYRLDEPGFNPLRAMAEIPCSSGSASSSS